MYHTILRSFASLTIALLTIIQIHAQSKVLGHEELAHWNQLAGKSISADGKYVTYEIRPNEGDPRVCLYTVDLDESRFFDRGSNPAFTYDGHFVIFKVSPPMDTLKEMRRRKVEKQDLPGDTLYIVNTASGAIEIIENVEKFDQPTKASGYIIYSVKPHPDKSEVTDSSSTDEKPVAKKHSEENGYPLVAYNLVNKQRDTLDFVTGFALSREGQLVAATTSGNDSLLAAGVYLWSTLNSGWTPIKMQKGKYDKLVVDDSGNNVAFVGDTDTSKAQVRPYDLYLWESGRDSAEVVAGNNDNFKPEDWLISQYASLFFSRDGRRLFFGISPRPLLQDTNLLEEEIVNVEVWHYLDDRVYTQQNVMLDEENKRSYLSCLDLASGEKHVIADPAWSEYGLAPEHSGDFVLLYREKPYLRALSWDGIIRQDIAVYDLRTHTRTVIAEGVNGEPAISPESHYAWWYNRSDSLWHVYTLESGTMESVKLPTRPYDELNDLPMEPDAYGSPGWTKADKRLIIYDRYDIWAFQPGSGIKPELLTDGREKHIIYRLIDLDKESKSIDFDLPQLLHMFNDKDKSSGYTLYDAERVSQNPLVYGPMQYTKQPEKARESNAILYTAESFKVFPDLRLTGDWFRNSTQVSNANPQQAEYLWGDAELFEWTAYDGKKLQGILVKPANFNPANKYPMLVNFYERSSDELYEHRTPFPHRSTINYSFYASRGYVIFNPDVVYDIGHPGSSAYNCVVSGTEAVVDLGFVDPERIGVQGHSWGGYQVADLITRTDIFRCAEAGAPLVNMINAYGGIRWQTGLSRMFQYEHTQSRLGVTPWEDIDLYIENSPWFNLDKVHTPVLIMHNDKDGHVPWHLGIEYFVAMRRLGKQAWMLNYNGEPHWPLKVQNRKDFNIRLQQYFDYFLKDAPMPKWMRDGVPATEKGIEQGYELIRD